MDLFKRNILGVDIGTRTIKGVRLKKTKGGRVLLTDHFFQDLAETSENFPENYNRDEAFKAAIEVQQLESAFAATSVRDSEVISVAFQLPLMSEKEVAVAVPQEIAEQANISIDDHMYDFLVTQKDSFQAIKAYCVKRDLILGQMKILKDVGLRPKAIESEMMAVTAMLEHNEYINKEEVFMVVDLGNSRLTTALIAEGALCLTRSHEVSFGAANKKLQEKLRISYEEAEKIKIKYDFISTPETNPGPANEIMDQTFTDVLKSIKEDLEFYKECSESFGRVDKILLVGGASQTESIVKIHEMFFKIPTLVVNPFRNIDIFETMNAGSSEEIAQLAPYMGAAVGLALASIYEGKGI